MQDSNVVIRVVRSAGIVLALAAFCLLVSFTSLFQYLNLKSYDILLRISPRRPNVRNVVVVGIDDRSIADIGRLPWDRTIIADLIGRISQGGASAIGVDLFFDLPAVSAEDSTLEQALARAGNVVLPVALISAYLSSNAQPSFSRWLQSLPRFRPAGIGHANSTPDSDGVCRRLQLSRGNGGRRYWAFPLELYRQATGLQADPVLEHDDSAETGSLIVPARRTEGYEILIHFAEPRNPIPTVNASDVLAGKWDPASVKGKAALIGILSPLEADQLFTSVSTEGLPMPGVLIHAHTVNMFFERSFLRDASPAVALVLVAGIVALIWLWMDWGPSRRNWVGSLILVMSLIASSCVLFWYQNYVLPLPTLLFTALTAIAVFHIGRLSEMRGLLRKEVHRLATQLQGDSVTYDPAFVAGRALESLRGANQWAEVILVLRSGPKELLRIQSGLAGACAKAPFRSSASICGEYLVTLGHPEPRTEDSQRNLDRVLLSLAHLLAGHFRGLQVRNHTPGFKDKLQYGAEWWQIHVLRQIGDEYQDGRSSTQAVLECISGGVALLDFTGMIRFTNAMTRKLLPFLGTDSTTQGFFEALVRERLISLEEANGYLAQWANPGVTIEIHLHRDQGIQSDLQLECSAIYSEEHVHLGAVIFITDVTDRVRLDTAKTEVVTLMSHELRTPLTSIRGFAQQLLIYSPDPDRVRRAGEVIVREATRLDQMTRSYLDLARLEQYSSHPNMVLVNLAAVAGAAVEKMASAAESKGILIRLTGSHIPLAVRGDADILERAVSNLIGNAIKYSKPGSGVDVRLTKENHTAAIEVADQGIGIPFEALPHIFEKFYRVKSASTSEIPGSGLGLAYVREAAAQHGGTVSVTSRPCEGSAFKLRLQLCTDSDIQRG